jgi:hypothetical protein
MVEDRLYRIEEKIDKLADMLVSLARVEQKLKSLEIDRLENSDRILKIDSRADARMTSLEGRVNKLELVDREQGITLKTLVRIFWLIASLTVGALITVIIK